jgi:pyrroline-5-carboxylate reductase
MTSATIAMIGAGNMGASLIGGLIQNGHPSEKIIATDTSPEKLAMLQETFQIRTTTNNDEAIQAADVVVLAVKPQYFESVVVNAKQAIRTRRRLIVSIAAGVRVQSIQAWLGGEQAIVRTMPNTPALIGAGAAALYANEFVNDNERNLAESILRAVGIAVWLNDESLMDTVTALSGSGPAYFFLFMEAMQHTAEELGLPTDTARLLTLQTALGAARMAIESGKPLDELRHNVTSPGGTTEKALGVLQEHHLPVIIRHALQAAKTRSEELADLMGKR